MNPTPVVLLWHFCSLIHIDAIMEIGSGVERLPLVKKFFMFSLVLESFIMANMFMVVKWFMYGSDPCCTAPSLLVLLCIARWSFKSWQVCDIFFLLIFLVILAPLHVVVSKYTAVISLKYLEHSGFHIYLFLHMRLQNCTKHACIKFTFVKCVQNLSVHCVCICDIVHSTWHMMHYYICL